MLITNTYAKPTFFYFQEKFEYFVHKRVFTIILVRAVFLNNLTKAV